MCMDEALLNLRFFYHFIVLSFPVSEQVCQTIEKELGKSMNDLFSDFVETPLATASVCLK